MDTQTQRDLPWGRLALGITLAFLALLVWKSLTHEPHPTTEILDLLHPVGAVDDLAPIEWTGMLPGDPYRFLVIIRDPDVAGVEGELARSPFLIQNRWGLAGVDTSKWGRIQIRVYVVDPGNMTEDFRKKAPMRTKEVIAWQRRSAGPGNDTVE